MIYPQHDIAYVDIPIPSKVGWIERRRLNKILNTYLPDDVTYETIPVDTVQDILNREGFVIIQEDGARWGGTLCGENGEAMFNIGRFKDGRTFNDRATYRAIKDMHLRMAWFWLPSGKYMIERGLTA